MHTIFIVMHQPMRYIRAEKMRRDTSLIRGMNRGKVQTCDMGNMRHKFSRYGLRPIYPIIPFPSVTHDFVSCSKGRIIPLDSAGCRGYQCGITVPIYTVFQIIKTYNHQTIELFHHRSWIDDATI